MFYSQFKVRKEDDDVLELYYNPKHLWFNLALGTVLFFYCIFKWMDSIAFLFAFGMGLMFLLAGSAQILYQREILIDKKREELTVVAGARWVYSKKRTVPFEKIGHIEINESALSNDGDFHNSSLKDTIYLNLKGANKIKLCTSCSEDYSNALTHKLSEIIGCKVICVRF